MYEEDDECFWYIVFGDREGKRTKMKEVAGRLSIPSG